MKQIRCRPYEKDKRDSDYKHWRSAPPFSMNLFGHLVHRVRHVITHRAGHSSIQYWCHNSAFLDRSEFTDDPPREKMLCARCEAAAVEAGEAAADEILERHIHLGEMRPHRLCHRKELEEN